MKAITYATTPSLSPVIDSELWELSKDWNVTVRGTKETLPKGFLTDGASIPRILWRVCGHPMATKRIIPAIVHDAIYAGTILGFTRKEADEIFRDGIIEAGWPNWKAHIEYAALRLFGSPHWRASAKAAAILTASLVLFTGCMRTIDIVKNDAGWEVHYTNLGLKTDVSSIEAEKTAEGVIKVKVKGLTTDVSAEHKEIVAAGGTAVGNVAEKIIEGVK